MFSLNERFWVLRQSQYKCRLQKPCTLWRKFWPLFEISKICSAVKPPVWWVRQHFFSQPHQSCSCGALKNCVPYHVGFQALAPCPNEMLRMMSYFPIYPPLQRVPMDSNHLLSKLCVELFPQLHKRFHPTQKVWWKSVARQESSHSQQISPVQS